MKLTIHENKPQAMSSYELWRQLNSFRAEAGQKEILHKDFIKRVIDECPETVGKFTTVTYNDKGQTIQAVNLNRDQITLVGMRESKVVRRKVLDWIKSINTQPAPQFQIPQTLSEALQLAANLETAREAAEQRAQLAEKTKSQISSKREATLMAKASIDKRKIDKLEKENEIFYKSSQVNPVGDLQALERKLQRLNKPSSEISEALAESVAGVEFFLLSNKSVLMPSISGKDITQDVLSFKDEENFKHFTDRLISIQKAKGKRVTVYNFESDYAAERAITLYEKAKRKLKKKAEAIKKAKAKTNYQQAARPPLGFKMKEDNLIYKDSSLVGKITIAQPVIYKWQPQEDITAYELALCLPIFARCVTPVDLAQLIERLPEGAKRHFELN